MFWSIMQEVRGHLPPLECSVVAGAILFLLTWTMQRRLVALGRDRRRRRVSFWLGVAGSSLIAAVSTAASWTAALRVNSDPTGVDGWLGRPAPLLTATLLLVIVSISLRSPRRAPSTSALLAPRRPWAEYAPRTALTLLAAALLLIAVVAFGHSVGATVAPADAELIGSHTANTGLPVFIPFNGNLGYLGGAGWPNHTATLAAAAAAAIAVVLALRADANRPLPPTVPAADARRERQGMARLFALVVLGGALATLGAVWMHVGSSGQGLIGIAEDAAGTPEHFVQSSFQLVAAPMNYAGYLFQGSGVALLLRLAVDTLRARFAPHTEGRTALAATPSPTGIVS